MNIPKVLEHIRPGARWTLRGDGLENLEWHDEISAMPTQDDLDEGAEQIDALNYRELRAAEYPSVGDQLDAVWKLLRNADDAQADQVRQAIVAVKARYPKP